MDVAVYTFLSLSLVLSAAGASAVAAEASTPSQQPEPLTRAAEEFKVLTRDRGMRPGRPLSAQKPGGRKMLWHGRLFENFRNDVLDAIPHQVKQNGESVSPLRRNQFGFNVAGPVLIPRLLQNPKNTFFALSYEGVREDIFRASLHTVPTAAQRTGDFSQTVDQAGNLLPIHNPATTSPNPAYNPNLPVSTTNLQYLRSTFPGNRIPATRLSPIVQQALTLYPLPNLDASKQDLESAQAELQASRQRLTALEADNAKLKAENRAGAARAAELAHVMAELQDLDSRRDAYLTSIMRRYHDITSQFRAMSGMLGSTRDSNSTSPFSDAALTRIQSAVSAADDDLRQLTELNDQARQLEKKLAKM
jgi:hypothetical protein